MRAARLFRGHGGLVAAAVLYAAVAAFAAGSLWLYGGFVKEAGWTWERTSSGVLVRSVDPHGPAAVLTSGARIVAVNGDQRAAVVGPRPWLQTVAPGQSYLLEWRTADGSQQQAALSMSRRGAELDLEMALCDLFLSLSFAAVGFLVWVAKPRDLVARWCSAAALLFAIYTAASAIGPVSPQFSGVMLATYFLLKALFPFHLIVGCELFARFPTGGAPRQPWRFALRPLWLLGAVVWIVTLPQRLFPYLGLEWRLIFLSGLDLATRPEIAAVSLRHGFIVLCGLFLFGVTLSNYRRLDSEAMRLRIRWVILGTIAGIMPGLLYSLAVAVADAAHWLPPETIRSLVRAYSVSTISLAAIPASIAYAIVCHRLMGIRVAFTNGVQYLYARSVIQIVTILPAIPLGMYLWRHRGEPLTESFSRPIIFVPAICLCVILLLRKELLDAGNRLLARLSGPNYGMEDLLEALFEQSSTGGIARTAASLLERALRPSRLLVCCVESDSKRLECVYTSDQDLAPVIATDSALATGLSERGPAFLNSKLFSTLPDAEHRWVSQSGLVLAAPIVGELRAKLSGIIFLGEKASGARYEATDLDLVEDAARQVYLALKMHELRVARDRALQGFQEVEAFAYVASHDLQEPLRTIANFTSLLAKRYSSRLDSEADDFLGYIAEASERLQLMIRDLLALARLSKPAPVDQVSASIVLNVAQVNLSAAIGESGAVLESSELPEVWANKIHLTQLFQNLIGNAIKYRSKEPPRITVSAERHTGCWNFSVRDNGRGFDMQHAQEVFLPFKRLSGGSDSGTGIGLAICKKIVENRGGRIWVESAPGCGTTFYFTIPDEPPLAL